MAIHALPFARRFFLPLGSGFSKVLQLALVLALAIGTLSSCAKTTLTLATTTSTYDSGLLDVLLPPFEEANGVEVRVIALGTGQAIALGERGDADLLLVHDPQREERFVAEGFGIERRSVMYNQFVIIGPEADPAQINGLTSAADAFARIASARATFVSRGDQSGTHYKEKEIWAQANIG